jgi:hypothetical protein
MPPGYEKGRPDSDWKNWWWVKWDGGGGNVYPLWSLNAVESEPVKTPIKEFEEL